VRVDPNHKDITVGREFLGARDGNRAPAQGDKVQIVVDDRGRHRGLVPSDARQTHRYRNYRIAGVEGEGTSRERYTLVEE
jgi:hypothetical protein